MKPDGAPGRIRTADAGLRTAALYPLSYGGAADIVPRRGAGLAHRDPDEDLDPPDHPLVRADNPQQITRDRITRP
jgi:hypothetical protein